MVRIRLIKCLVTLMIFSLLAIPSMAASAANPDCFDMIADGGDGSGTLVGHVCVWNDNDVLYVQYMLDSGWEMTASHVAVATVSSGIPQTKTFNPKVGQFAYHEVHEIPVSEYTYKIPLTGLGGSPYIAAHADVRGPSDHSTEVFTVLETSLELPACVNYHILRSPYGTYSYFQTGIFGPADSPLLNDPSIKVDGVSLPGYAGWCAKTENLYGIYTESHYGKAFLSTDDRLFDRTGAYLSWPAGYPWPVDESGNQKFSKANFCYVNWILNQNYQEQGYSYRDIQAAIWYFVAETDSELIDEDVQELIDNTPRAEDIISDAKADGAGFYPGYNQIVALVLVPVTSECGMVVADKYQLTIIEYSVGDSTSYGIYRYETAWADGTDFGGSSWATYFQYQVTAVSLT